MEIDNLKDVIICDRCYGLGFFWLNNVKTQCSKCEGKGRLLKTTVISKLKDDNEEKGKGYIDYITLANLSSSIESQIAKGGYTNYNKLKIKIGRIQFGSKVTITDEDGYVTEGYLTTIPNNKSENFMASAIVHIPYNVGELSEWQTLLELLNNSIVTEVKIDG